MERYRGTEWDNLTPEPDVLPALPTKRGGPSFLLILGVVVLALLGAGVFIGLRPPIPMPGAVSRRQITQPSPFVPPSAFEASVAPQASIDPALADTPAGPFMALMMAGDQHYYAEAIGTLLVGDFRRTVSIEVAVSGADLDGTWVVAQGRERRVTSVIVKDDRYFVKPADDPWQLSETGDGLPTDVFSRIPSSAWQALIYVAAEERGGRHLHHLRLPAFEWPAAGDAIYLDDNQRDAVIHEIRVDVWVTEAGKPFAAVISLDGSTRADGIEVDLFYELEYEFSRVGQRVDIEAPG
jgi:hypothetical protein